MNLKLIISKFDWKLTGLIGILIFIETLAQTTCEHAASLVKKTKLSEKNLSIIGGVLLYGLVGYLYYIALESRVSLAIVNIIWQTLTIILVTLVSVFIFKQPITKKEIIGIIIVIIGSFFFVPSNKQKIESNIAIAGKDAINVPPYRSYEQLKKYNTLKIKKDI